MNKPNTCLVCGQPVERHTIALRDGIAHTLAPNGASCSGWAGDREYTRGRLAAMQTIIRSLRWRSRRVWQLYDYSVIVEREREQLLRRARRWFPWSDV